MTFGPFTPHSPPPPTTWTKFKQAARGANAENTVPSRLRTAVEAKLCNRQELVSKLAKLVVEFKVWAINMTKY